MDDRIFEVTRHVKWSKNKSGTVMIYNRISRKTFLIDTTSGKIIWEAILRKATQKEIVEEIRQIFNLDNSAAEISDDVTEFLNGLADANIIHSFGQENISQVR